MWCVCSEVFAWSGNSETPEEILRFSPPALEGDIMMKDLAFFPALVWTERKAVAPTWLCSVSGFLPGSLKYSCFKYCKTPHLIKALVFINETHWSSFLFYVGKILSPATPDRLTSRHFFLSYTAIHTFSGGTRSSPDQTNISTKSFRFVSINLFMFLSWLLRQH